jgi:NADPH:quinone reductase-like Zn-dependent oxidoreductase
MLKFSFILYFTDAKAADGTLRPVIDEVLPMERVAEAHARMERDETFGKLVLAWGG